MSAKGCQRPSWRRGCHPHWRPLPGRLWPSSLGSAMEAGNPYGYRVRVTSVEPLELSCSAGAMTAWPTCTEHS